MIKHFDKAIFQTAILCLVTIYLTFRPHTGFVLLFIILCLTPSFLKSFYLIVLKKRERKQRAIKTALWVITCSAVIGHHVYLHKTTRAFANQFSSEVILYHTMHHKYPESHETIGFNNQELRKFGVHYNYIDKGKNGKQSAILFYRVTWIIYDIYSFDFENNQWEYWSS